MDYYLHITLQMGIYIILAVSLNLINGFCGQFSLGHAGFYGVGAYVGAVYSAYHKLPLPNEINLLIAIVLGFLGAAICGLMIGGSCLRLRGDYLAIATLGFGEIIRISFMNIEYVGGARGLTGIPNWVNVVWVYSFVVLIVFFMFRLKYSAFGRAIIAIREDEVAAENMGINLFQVKLFVFIIGAGFAGVAGVLYAHSQQYINPNDFTFMVSVMVLVMIILGGLGSITGAILGAMIVHILPQALGFIQGVTEYKMTALAVALILLMLLRPDGIFGSYEIFEKRRLLKLGNKL